MGSTITRCFVESDQSQCLALHLLAALALSAAFHARTAYADPPIVWPPHPNPDAWYVLGPGARGVELKDGADLSGVDLRGMTLYRTDHHYSQVRFCEANLSGANLEGADILYTEFKNCTFRKALMRGVSADWGQPAPGCDFTDADIAGGRIHLDAGQLRSTWNYKNKDLSHTKIRLSGEQTGHDFARFNLRGTEFISSDLGQGPLFPGGDFTDADIRGAFIRLADNQLRATKNYQSKDLADTTLVGDFAGVSFQAFDLRNTTFMFCNLEGCAFADAEISGMSIYGAGRFMDKGRWTTALDPSASRFRKEQLYATKNYRGRDLDRVRFQGCDFRNADFSNQTLGLFEQCDLQGADFTNADHITGPDDHWTERLELPNPIGFEACNLSAEQFQSTRIYASKKFQPGAMMAGMDLRDWDFSGFDLRYVIFDDSVVDNASFENARGGDFTHAQGLSASQVESMWNFEADRIRNEPGFALPSELLKEFAEKKVLR